MGFEFYGNPTLDAAYEQARAAAAAWYRDPGDANSAALESANAQMTSILQRYQRGELTPAMQAAAAAAATQPNGRLTTDQTIDIVTKIEKPTVTTTRTTGIKSYKKPAAVGAAIAGGVWLLTFL